MALLQQNNKWTDILLCALFPLIMVDYFLIMLEINLNSVLVLPILFATICFALYYVNRSVCRHERASVLLILFLVYNLVSFFVIVANDIPIECFTNRLRSFLFPMLFFFFGIENKITDDKFYKSFLISALICFAVGILLYIWGPDFYTSYLVNIREETYYMEKNYLTEVDVLEYTRFSSFFSTSYAVSYLSIPALCISNAFMFRKTGIRVYYLYAAVFLCFISAILCQQRVAMTYGFFVILFFSLFSKRQGNSLFLPLFIAMLFLAFVLANQYVDSRRLSSIWELLIDRWGHMDYEEAMGGRTGQYDRVLRAWSNYIIGDGMGSHSGIAMKYNYVVVNDGEYYRILVENGIVGFLIFFTFIISVLKNAFIWRKYYWMEILVVLFYLVAGIGSNSLSIMFFYTPVFWFCLGRLCNKNYLERLRIEKNDNIFQKKL